MKTPAFIKRVEWLPIFLLAPVTLIVIAIIIWPILQALSLSFYNTRILNYNEGRFIGLLNYVVLWQDEYFWNSLKVTAIYGLSTMLLTYGLGLTFAMLLYRPLPARGFLRTIFILPWAIPEVVAVMIFVWMLDPQFGVINHFLMQLGFIDAPIAWLSRSNTAMPALVLVTAWRAFPLAMLILLAGLQTIPKEHYEAAMIDGAGPIARFFHVTLPGLRAVNVILILLLILNSFRAVTMIYAMTRGGPARSTETLSILTYNTAFDYQRIGYAAAQGTVLLFILLVLSIIYFSFALRDRKSS